MGVFQNQGELLLVMLSVTSFDATAT
jgi:hypothetical protein